MDEIGQSMTVENPGFPRLGGGANPNGREGAPRCYLASFPEICMKMKNIEFPL